RRACDSINHERLDERRIFFVIEEFGIRQSGISLLTARRRIQRKHAVLVRDQGVGANQNSFDPAQDRGVCADPEDETKNRQNRKSRSAPKHARAEANILKKFIRPSPEALLTRDFLDLLDSAEFA